MKVVRVPPSIHRTEAGTPRARAPRACNECHTHKTRCTAERPQCKRCKAMNVECVYEKSKRKSASAVSSSRPSTSSRDPGGGPSQPSPLAATALGGEEHSLEVVQQSIESVIKQESSRCESVSSLAVLPERRLSVGNHLFVEYVAFS